MCQLGTRCRYHSTVTTTQRQTKPPQDFSLQAKSQQEQPPERKQASDNVTKGPIMVYRDYKWPFILYTDASKEGLGLYWHTSKVAENILLLVQSQYSNQANKMIQIAAPLGLDLSSLTHAHHQHIYHDAPQHFMELLFHCLEENLLSLFSPGISNETHSSHTPFNSWKTFMDNRGTADHGLQSIDFKSFDPRLQTEISRLYHSWCVPEGIQVLVPAEIPSYSLCKFRMRLRTFWAN